MGCNNIETYQSNISSVAGAIATIEMATPLYFTYPSNLNEALLELDDPSVTIPSIRYGTSALTQAIVNVLYPNVIQSELYAPIIPSVYPFLNDRLNAGTGIITYTEFADYLDYMSYPDVPRFVDIATKQPDQVLREMNHYYEDRMSGSAVDLCAMLANPFGAAQDILNKVQGMIGTAQDILTMLPAIAAQLKSFAEMVKGKVENLFETLKGVVQNMAQQAMSVVQNLSKIPAAFEGIARTLTEKMIGLESLLSQTNLDTIKENIDKFVTKAALQFKKLLENPEVILHLLYMFCKTVSSIEGSLRSPIQSVQSMIGNLAHEQNLLRIRSSAVSRRAVEAGRPTATAYAADGVRNSRAQSHNDALADATNSGIDTNEQYVYTSTYSSHPDPSSWSNLSFTKKVVDNDFFKVNRNYPLRGGGTFNPIKEGVPPNIGYIRAQLRELEMLNEVGKRIGKKLLVSSAYRHPAYNYHVGGAAASQHMAGKALDVMMSGVNRKLFVETAKMVGFRGFGRYGTFIHVDTGPARTW